MARVSELLFTSKTLQKNEPIAESGDPATIKTTPTISRVSANELELAYINDPIIFNGVNKVVQTIMAAHYEITAKDKKVKQFFDDFTSNLGNSGSLITWEGLLTNTFKNQCIFGWSWIENVYNKKGNLIVDWDIVDPKKMNYAKDGNNKLVLDKLGRPVGYVQRLPTDMTIEQKYPVPPQVSLNMGELFIPPEKLALVKLYQIGDGFYPVGIVEPCYKAIIRKLNINDAIANSYWRHGFPTIWAQVGDMNHEPTPNQIQSLLGKLKDLNNRKEIVTPYYYKLNMLEANQNVSLSDHLTIFRDDEIAGMGVPKPFVTGGGEETNRATLNRMSDLFQLTLSDIVKSTCQSIRINLFKPLAQVHGFKEVPNLEWDVIGVGELDAKADRIVNYVKSGVLPVTLELQKYIERLEKLN